MTTLLEYLGLEKPKTVTRDMKQAMFFSQMHLDSYGVVLVKGDPGSGKSTWGFSTAWIRRKLWGYPVVSNVLAKPAFGEYTYLDTESLVGEFLKVNAAVEKEVRQWKHSKKLSPRDEEVAGSAWEGSNIALHNSTIIWDEGYGSLDKRRFMSPKMILLSYLVQQQRHFNCLIIIMASTDKMLDDIRINPFASHEVNCGHFPDLGVSFYNVYHRYSPIQEGINPQRQQIKVANWAGQIFDSFCPVAVDVGLLKGVLKEGQL